MAGAWGTRGSLGLGPHTSMAEHMCIKDYQQAISNRSYTAQYMYIYIHENAAVIVVIIDRYWLLIGFFQYLESFA